MTSDLQLLRETAHAIFAGRAAKPGEPLELGWDKRLWDVLADSGLTLVGTAEHLGGSGGGLLEAAEILLAVGSAAPLVPVAETMVTAFVLATAGVTLLPGPLALALDGAVLAAASPSGREPCPELRRVPYGRVAAALVAPYRDSDGEWLQVVPAPVGRVIEGYNIVGEPRDDIVVDPAGVGTLRYPAPRGTCEFAVTIARLARTVLLAGAAGRALELTVQYVGQREQFGRPLARFQAVQQQLAIMASEVAIMRSAADAAVHAQPEAEQGEMLAVFAVTAAKAQVSSCAGTVAAIAHQLHGAIGTTSEHPLRLTTTRLWAWRDENGSESQLFSELGRQALACGPNGLWPLITSSN